QCAIPLCTRTTAAFQKTAAASWPEPKPQSPDEGDFQEYGYQRYSLCRTIPGFLREIAGQMHGARHGSAHAGPQDRGDNFDHLEERRPFRRQSTKSTERASSLSVVSNPS